MKNVILAVLVSMALCVAEKAPAASGNVVTSGDNLISVGLNLDNMFDGDLTPGVSVAWDHGVSFAKSFTFGAQASVAFYSNGVELSPAFRGGYHPFAMPVLQGKVKIAPKFDPYVTSTVGTSLRTSIANFYTGLNYTYDGAIAEVSFFDNAISIGDVWDGSGQPIDVSGVSGITNYWKMGENATYVENVNPDGTWTIPDEVGTIVGTSYNLMADSARVGEAPNSVNNALSFNMDLIDRVEDTPPTP